ncbi:hypothetical protein DM860_010705 [Cuscuta australis]|uniref:C2 NT-type domain-containing protein n=1 Tax=Cuscuta australis TaxID=267555 RepID=A0A328E3Z9_9ASTE|nr:hypothetical protein DM860_010705 [Cuscuta australis]
MVVKMMKWRSPWPPPLPSSKKLEAKIGVLCINGLLGADLSSQGFDRDFGSLGVEIRWKGAAAEKGKMMKRLRRGGMRRDFTKEGIFVSGSGAVVWDEQFMCECNFSPAKDDNFLPWDVSFSLFNVVLSKGNTKKASSLATGSLNLSDYVIAAKEKDVQISIPLAMSHSHSPNTPLLSLCLSLSLAEMRNDDSPSRVGVGKVGIFKAFSPRRGSKSEDEGSNGKSSIQSSEDTECNYVEDADSEGEGGMEEGQDGEGNYEILGCAKSHCVRESEDDRVYYSHPKPDVGCPVYVEDTNDTMLDNKSIEQRSKRGILLPWGKRKFSFRSSPKRKGEPLLKKHYGEEGGDDIDFDRRQLSSSDESSYGWRSEDSTTRSRSSVSEFGEDNFEVGSWEVKEVISRDGEMKLRTQMFFASIDQRSERAAGEGACTSLVVAVANWFHSNPNQMPIKSQLDTLIHEGSMEWRNMCEDETYRERFPDKHFDLDTVLRADVTQPLAVVPHKSFVGFFLLEEQKQEEEEEDEDEEGGFDEFLRGAMSFVNIWDEISQGSDDGVYIVSWNDHFFVLKVERDAYYIVDTLGERLYEGCDRAFILKFDKDTSIVSRGGDKEEERVWRGKEACKEYIKSFLAGIPVRELQVEVKTKKTKKTKKEKQKKKKRKEEEEEEEEGHVMGSMMSLVHQRLQIEFHYTQQVSGA